MFIDPFQVSFRENAIDLSNLQIVDDQRDLEPYQIRLSLTKWTGSLKK